MRRHENVLVLNASNGMLLYPLMRSNPEGLSTAVVKDEEQKDVIEHFSKEMEELLRPRVIVSSPLSSFSLIENDMRFAVVSGRNILSRLEKDKAVLHLIKERLEKDGEMALIEAVPSLSSRLSSFAPFTLRERMTQAEAKIYSDPGGLLSWGKEELEKEVSSLFEDATFTYREMEEPRHISRENAESWYNNTYSKYNIDKDEFITAFSDKTVNWKNTVALIRSNTRRLKEEKKNEHEEVKKSIKGEK